MSGALLERIEALWASPALGMWAMLAAAVVVALVMLVLVLKADRTLANGALAVITLLALGVAAAALMRERPVAAVASAGAAAAGSVVGQAALACLDGLAGERVESVCEKALFASADTTAAAVSYTAAQVSRLPLAAAQGGPELGQLRRVLERDRFGLVAQVLTVREGCTPDACDAFRHLTNSSQIAANMTGRAFENVVARYADTWGEAPQMASAPSSAAPAAPSASKPSTIDFPSSASIPSVDIMSSPEPRRGAGEPPPIVTVTQPPPASPPPPPAPAPVAAAPSAPLPGSVAFPPSSLPQQSLPLQQPSPVQMAAPPPPAPKSASTAPAQPKRAAPPKRQPAPAAPPPVSLVPAQQEQSAEE